MIMTLVKLDCNQICFEPFWAHRLKIWYNVDLVLHYLMHWGESTAGSSSFMQFRCIEFGFTWLEMNPQNMKWKILAGLINSPNNSFTYCTLCTSSSKLVQWSSQCVFLVTFVSLRYEQILFSNSNYHITLTVVVFFLAIWKFGGGV